MQYKWFRYPRNIDERGVMSVYNLEYSHAYTAMRLIPAPIFDNEIIL